MSTAGTRWFRSGRGRFDAALLFATGLTIATGLTFWLAFRATREWQRSTAQAADTRGNEVVALLAVALERDMKGGQTSVLLPLNETVINSAPYDLADRFARGFVRFPYLESFFVWTAEGGPEGTTYVFHRADRRPRWDDAETPSDPYPVVFHREPGPFRGVMTLVKARAAVEPRFTMFETTLDGVPYQVLAHPLYDGPGDQPRLSAVAGSLVNLAWVRAHYFADFTREIQNVIGDTTVTMEIADSDGRIVAAVGPPSNGPPQHVRTFPLLFADQALLPDSIRRQRLPTWTARVGVSREASLVAASRGTTRTLTLLGLGGFVTIVGLVSTVRAARRAADLAMVQSEFVSAVSHEMKTPLSLIKLASDTLENGRYDSPGAIPDYGRLMGIEVQHLTRLIDNVLCYARINDTSSAYTFETIDVVELVHESVDRFRPQLTGLAIHVQFNMPAEPAYVRADHLMLKHVVDNLVDNVTKYGASGGWMGVSVRESRDGVHIEIADRGEGIPAADQARVFDKFYRRKGNRQRGAGLGLAIVRRIVEDHGGRVTLTSTPGEGTAVQVMLPARDASA